LAPTSSTTVSPRTVGHSAAIAGRSIPSIAFSWSLAIAISAPVLPAETTACASPERTDAMARHMLVERPRSRLPRNTWLGLSCISTTSGAWRSVDAAFSAGRASRSGARRASSP
jgi:hypothetical protein